jgi:hypothetical protein
MQSSIGGQRAQPAALQLREHRHRDLDGVAASLQVFHVREGVRILAGASV